MKKGAMFGLDARIALAIFGALSVISGAALYSAIQQSKITQATATLNELSKAYDSYVIDVGEELALDPSYSYGIYVELKKVVSDTVSGWKGPYMSADAHATLTHLLKNSLYDNSHFFVGKIKDSEWGEGSSNTTASQACDSSNTCFIWVGFNQVPLEIAKGLDLEIDGSVDFKAGNVRVDNISSDYHVYWKHRAIIN